MSLKFSNTCENEYEKICKNIGVAFQLDSDKIHIFLYNIRITYFPNSKILIVSNSFHKLYNNHFLNIGSNHTDFTMKDFYATADFLCEVVLEKSMNDGKVCSKFEFGVNVDCSPYIVFPLITKCQAHATTHINEFFTVPPYTGKPIQRTAYQSDYRIKVYDKGVQAKLTDNNLLRYEIVITEIRKLKALLCSADVTLATLVQPYAWNKLFDFILMTYAQIRKIPQLPQRSLLPEHINSIYGYCNPLMRKDLQENLSRYEFNKLNKYNKAVYDAYSNSSDNFFNELFERIEAKRLILINNESNFTSCNEQ